MADNEKKHAPESSSEEEVKESPKAKKVESDEAHTSTSKEKQAPSSEESEEKASNDEGGDASQEDGELHPDVPYDPNAKPAKGILKKPGEEASHKSESHIHITSTDDGAVHDAEQKGAPKKQMPVEGRTGVVKPGSKKGSISSSSSEPKVDKAAATNDESKPKSTSSSKVDKDTAEPSKKSKKSDKEGKGDTHAAELKEGGEKDPEKCVIQ